MAAKARLQINFMISTVDDIKQVAGLPEIVYPLFWFESVSYTSDYSIIILKKRKKKKSYSTDMNLKLNRASTLCRNEWQTNCGWYRQYQKLPAPEFLTQCLAWAESYSFALVSWSGRRCAARLTVPVAATLTSSLRSERTESPPRRPDSRTT